MFTGIVRQSGTVLSVTGKDLLHIQIDVQKPLKGLTKGSSVAINGVCLTVTKIQKSILFFDVMSETLRATTLGALKAKQRVHVEPSAKFGDEIGGHVISGHVSEVAKITDVEKKKENVKVTFQIDKKWMKYIFDKGFLALDGCSLTVNETNKKRGLFSVWLIPETLQTTTFRTKKKGDLVNVEIDAMTQAVVETVERLTLHKR